MEIQLTNQEKALVPIFSEVTISRWRGLTYQGLKEEEIKTEPVLIEKGLTGIASCYSEE